MEQPEDISQLVVGMTGNSVFNDLFSGAQGMTGERLTAWFDTATATLGGRDVIEAVREMLGNVSRFDFQTVGRDLPQVDIPDLERFFTLAAGRHKRRVRKGADGLGIRAPDTWKSRSYAVRDRYDGLVFDRGLRGEGAASRVLGVGHTLFDIALDEARNLPVRAATLEGIGAPILVVSVEDEVTGTGSLVHRLIFGVTEVDGHPAPLRDWETPARPEWLEAQEHRRRTGKRQNGNRTDRDYRSTDDSVRRRPAESRAQLPASDLVAGDAPGSYE